MIGLNDAQKAAVCHERGPALVLAGAGSGKTRVIISRMVWLVRERGVDPRNLLALTFTNRAAREMKERAEKELATSGFGAWLGTFHSFGLYVLRREMDKLGRRRSFTVYDDQDQLSLMKRLARDENVRGVSPRQALQWISGFKQGLKVPSEKDAAEREYGEELLKMWGRYHSALEANSAVDFDDLLVLPARLFSKNEEIRQKYALRFRHVLVDEYQDTNRAQYEIVRLLAGKAGYIFAVGDEDQSIYSWRGAEIRNILDFEKDFPGATIYRLEQNYRSTRPILDAANAIVAKNQQRLGKVLWTEQTKGDPVRYHLAESGEAEARFVPEDMERRALEGGSVAVMYRTNGQSRLVEEALRLKGLAYAVVGGIQFYARKEVKDLTAYLRLLVNTDDDEALRRIINVPARGIGGATLTEFEARAEERNYSLFQALRDVEDDQSLGSRVRSAAGEFVRLIDDLALEAKCAPVAEVVKGLLAKTGYRDYVARSDEKDFRSRLEIVDEFVSACAQYDAQEGKPLAEYLQDFALVTDADSLEAGAPVVTLLTCHSAKGLEFDHVYLLGLEEGLLPHATALDSPSELEEERRLCYVAMTRARKSLTLCSAQTRLVYGERRVCVPSRFLSDIPGNLLSPVGGRAPVKTARIEKPETPAAPSAGEVRMGARVRHATFGRGVVMYTRGTGPKTRVKIRFETGRMREFMLGAAPLEILEKER